MVQRVALVRSRDLVNPFARFAPVRPAAFDRPTVSSARPQPRPQLVRRSRFDLDLVVELVLIQYARAVAHSQGVEGGGGRRLVFLRKLTARLLIGFVDFQLSIFMPSTAGKWCVKGSTQNSL